MIDSTDPIISAYHSRIDSITSHVSQLKATEIWWGRARGLAFLVVLVLLFLGYARIAPRSSSLLAAFVAFVGFLVIVAVHEGRLAVRRMEQLRGELQRQQLARFERRWRDLPPVSIDVPANHRPLATDLDLFSHGGLFLWLCRAHTPGGQQKLRDWLLEPASPEEIAARQAAVQCLAKMREVRDEMEFHARLVAASRTGPAGLIEWAESAPWLTPRHGLRGLIRLLAGLMIVIPCLVWLQVLPISWCFVILGQIAIHVLLNALFVGGVHDLFNKITAGNNELTHYAVLFRTVDNLPSDPPKLASLRSRLTVGKRDFRQALRQLQRVMGWGSGRRSSVFGVPYVAAQILFFWDFFVLERLERWQAEFGPAVRGWFESVSELESLCSLAAVAADHPAWSYPDVNPRHEHWQAEQLGHPLIPIPSCARNDVRLGPTGTFLLVTGSNMSGKSTLLRAIGINTILAQCGGPTCATRLQMPPVELATSMRVTDSLQEGVSFFFAELQRLKSIVDRARVLGNTHSHKLLFLLDEILQGTNSAERQIAVARVIGFLIEQPTLGAVSTHDLELAGVPELSRVCQAIHFREQFRERNGQKQMTFDYQLRAGVSPTTNALQLLELVGLT